MYRFLYDSDSKNYQNEIDEDDVMIPDFRKDEVSAIEDTSAVYFILVHTRNSLSFENKDDPTISPSSFHSQDPLPAYDSDSEDDVPLAELECENLNVLTKLRGFKRSQQKSVLHLPRNTIGDRNVTVVLHKRDSDKITEYSNNELKIQKLKYANNMDENGTEDTSILVVAYLWSFKKLN